MDKFSILLMLLSISFSTGRNLLSKSISKIPFGQRGFFRNQAIIFASGSVVLFLLSIGKLSNVSLVTCLYSMLFSGLLLTAQWCYTAALNRGNVSVCTIIYSFGFIIPSLAGMIFWSEKVTLFKVLGILIVIPVIILAGSGKQTEQTDKKNGSFLIPLLVAMTASGCLGIVQKSFQSTSYAGENTVFVLLAFLISTAVSFCCCILCRKEENTTSKRIPMAIGAGICYGGFNITNTVLVGMVDSSVLFPMLNISMILLSMALSVVFFKEKITRKKILIVALGIIVIMLINLSS